MKKLLLAIAVFSAVCPSVADTRPENRHQNQDVVVADSAFAGGDSIGSCSGIPVPCDGSEDYTDSAALGDDVSLYDRLDPGKYTDPFSYFAALWTAGFGGVLIGLFIMLVVLLCFAAPVIIVVFLLRYLIKRHNDRVALAEKAMELGQAVPQPKVRVGRQGDEYMLHKGIRNTAIGVGLVLMFMCWEAGPLVGVGFLVMCYGVGQVVIGRAVMGASRQRKGRSDAGDVGPDDGGAPGSAGFRRGRRRGMQHGGDNKN